MGVVQKDEEYNYNDMGLMLMKEVMEKVTEKNIMNYLKNI